MAVVRRESELRDYLADRLNLIEPGLTLEQAEFPLANAFGSAGRVDILARDRDGILVVIEIKRSDATARQALHELNKYTGLMLDSSGLGVSEVRCLLLSTSWRELLVPFSQHVRSTPYETRGLLIELGDDGLPHALSDVALVPLEPFVCCPWSQYFLYTRPDDRSADLSRVETALSRLGVADYFCLVEDHGGSDERITFDYALHLFIGALPASAKALVGRAAPEMIDDDDEWGHELAVLGLALAGSRPDSADSGTPEQAMMEGQNWLIRSVVRGGRFASSTAWPDERLESIARGNGFNQVRRFTAVARPIRKGRWERLRSDADTVLAPVPSWRASFERLFGVTDARPEDLVECHIFLPQDLGRTFSALAVGSEECTPMFRFSQSVGQENERQQFGGVVWDGRRPPASFESALALCGGLSYYLVLRMTGELGPDDAELMRLHGFTYETLARLPVSGDLVVLDPVTGTPVPTSAGTRPLLLRDFAARYPSYLAGARTLLANQIA